ncbi:MAG: alpha-E domain-containing protein [Pseudomonadota bacterium]
MHNLLSRQAAAVFWMARQVERANNVARILDVTASFSRDETSTQPWQAVIDLYNDADLFAQRYAEATPENVLQFYILDADNPNSILNNVSFARENARALRPLLSTEMWTQLNVFHSTLHGVKKSHIRDEKVADFCAMVKRSCQTHSGLVSETMFRDEEWYFYCIGNALERADQTTRLVDVKYHLLLPTSNPVGSQIDISQWNAVLRSAAGFQAYRRVHHRGLTGKKVAAFLLLDRRFPRSVCATSVQACDLLQTLIQLYDLPGGDAVLSQMKALALQARDADIESIIDGGMHEWIDDVQKDIAGITIALGDAFFADADTA